MAREKDRTTTPPQYDVSPPPYSSPSDYGSIEILMSMQATMGKLTEAVDSLKSQAKDHGDKLSKLSHIIYTAGVIGTILLGIGIWLLNKIVDVILPHFSVATK